MINILTDTCSDLGAQLAALHNIRMIPLSVTVGDKVYKDGVDIQTPQLLRMVEEGGVLPKTSAPSVGEFVNFFNSVDGDIIFIGVSAKLSATVQNAILAVENLNGRNIRVIDSMNLSAGEALLVLKAVELRDQGLGLDEIAQQLDKARSKVRTSFTIDTLDFLYKGGRCSAMENIVASLLKIRPVIYMQPDGALGVKEKHRGSRIKVVDAMIADFAKNVDKIDLNHVFMIHTFREEGDVNYICAELKKIVPSLTIHTGVAGSTIASHCGPNTFGVLYLMN